jgi:hypothetical protein
MYLNGSLIRRAIKNATFVRVALCSMYEMFKNMIDETIEIVNVVKFVIVDFIVVRVIDQLINRRVH